MSRGVIAYLTSEYARAGDTFIRREVQELRKLGFEVHTFSIRRNRSEIVSDEIRSEQASTIYILDQPLVSLLAVFLLELFRTPRSLWRAWRLAMRVRTPGMKGLLWGLFYLIEGAYLSRRLRQLSVRHLHNHIAENSATAAMLASEISAIPFSLTVHGPHEFFVVTQIGLAEKIAKSKFVACISSFTKSQCMIWSAHEHWNKLHVVRCGLDERFRNPPNFPIENPNRFVSVGRLCPDKGQLLLMDAAAKLKSLGSNFTIEVIGDGPSRPAIEASIRMHSLEDRVQLRGWQDSEEIRRSLLDAAVMILPSFAEGLPVVIMESLALERPVISTYIAGIPELVKPGENGWLVPAGDVDALAAAIQDAIQTPKERLAEMGQAGREAVLSRHDIRTEAGKLAQLFEQANAKRNVT